LAVPKEYFSSAVSILVLGVGEITMQWIEEVRNWLNINPIELLKAPGEIWGLKAPAFTLWAAGGLLALPLCALVYLWWCIRRESRILNRLARSINELKKQYSVVGRQGLSLAGYDK